MAVVDIVRFRLKDDTDVEAFRALNERFQREIAPTLPGLERREATIGADGEWLLVLRYQDLESATRGPAADTSPLAGAFMDAIDPASMSMAHYEVVSE